MGQYIEVIATFRGGEMETKRALDSLKKWCSVGDRCYEELGKKKVLPGGEVERRAYFSGNKLRGL